MSKLNKIGLRVSPLSGKVVIARFGKNPNVALETRECLNEFLHAVEQFVGVDCKRQFGNDDDWFEVSLVRVKKEAAPEDRTDAAPLFTATGERIE